VSLGFYIIMAAQFFSSLADNALLVAAIALLIQSDSPGWLTPYLKFFFVISYVVLAPYVGAFADRLPKGQVMLVSNAIKILGCSLMLFEVNPLIAYALVGLGAAAYSPGQVRHPHRVSAADQAGDRERLDRRAHRGLHHPRHRAGRRPDQPAGGQSPCSVSISRTSTPASTRRPRRPSR
jgi:MFS family permease